ncbi:MAG: hypothetical protein QG608_1883, partial [Actinomycetota bacterium]|nr:hypothetical protein [Actinomycetota bacterium]
SVVPSQNNDAFATNDTGEVKVLIGCGKTTGNVALS